MTMKHNPNTTIIIDSSLAMMKNFMTISFVALFLLSSVSRGQHQETGVIGTDICSCSPSTYEFTLDFSLSCPPINVTIGNAVEATSCLTSPYGSPGVRDLVPVAVTRINILELGQNYMVVSQSTLEKEDFVDGETVTFSSLSADPERITTIQDIPKALQINLEGVNSLDQKIINVFIIRFTNRCESLAFEEGMFAGWMRFTGIGPASSELCAAAPDGSLLSLSTTTVSPRVLPETETPTLSPITRVVTTANPTILISLSPTAAPTDSPTSGRPSMVPVPQLAPIPSYTLIASNTTLAPTITITDTPTAATLSQQPSLRPTTGTSSVPTTEVVPTDTPTTIAAASTRPSLRPTTRTSSVPTKEVAPIDTPMTIDIMRPTTVTRTSVPTLEVISTDTPTAIDSMRPTTMTETTLPAVVEVFPTDDPPTTTSMSMSMSMSMSLDLRNLREFGDWTPLRNTKMKDRGKRR